MSFFKQLLMNFLRGNKWGGHHGSSGYGNNRHGYSKHGNYNTNPFADPIATQSSQTCPNCNAANLESARFCQGCGASLVGTTCTSCGAALAVGAKFCGQCGKAS